jgi:hypothetical protein
MENEPKPWSERPNRRERELAEWFLREYEGNTSDDFVEMLAAYRRELVNEITAFLSKRGAV